MFDNDQDHYYIDTFNLMDTTYLNGSGSPSGMEGTQRLYTTTGDGQLDKCILIAPYIDPMQYVGRNSWSDGAGSMMDNITDIFNNVMSSFNNMVINAQDDLDRMSDFLRAMFPKATDFADKMGLTDLKKKAQKLLETIPCGEYKAINIGSFKKQYLGSSVEPPITSMSAMYFSNPGDFQWFNSEWTNEKQPLRKMCAILMRILVGDTDAFMEPMEGKDGGQNSIVQYAPMGIESRKLDIDNSDAGGTMKRIIGRTFAIAVSDTNENDKGAVRIIRNLLPESLTITPSRILTRDNDYYYVKIDVTFSLATYIGAKDVATNWIADNLTEDKYSGFKSKQTKTVDQS